MPLHQTGISACGTDSLQRRTEMTRLYVSAAHPGYWVGYVAGTGWTIFPARENGWEQRRPARGLDPMHLREVPARLASRTGLPDAEPVPEFAEVA
jgi:hypothetical protein